MREELELFSYNLYYLNPYFSSVRNVFGCYMDAINPSSIYSRMDFNIQ